MTDEEILDRITEILDDAEHPDGLDEIRSLVRDHRQVGWKRRFLDSPEWRVRHADQTEELKRPRFRKADS